MDRRFRNVDVILVAIWLYSAFPVALADQTARFEVRQAASTPYDTGDPEVLGFDIKFNLKITNASGRSINLPDTFAGSDSTVQINVMREEARQRDGRWLLLSESTLVTPQGITYEPCVSLSPGTTKEITDITYKWVGFRKQFAELGDKPTLRLRLIAACQLPNGKVSTIGGDTDAFEVQLVKMSP